MQPFIPVHQYDNIAEAMRSGQMNAAMMCFLLDNDILFRVWYRMKYCKPNAYIEAYNKMVDALKANQSLQDFKSFKDYKFKKGDDAL